MRWICISSSNPALRYSLKRRSARRRTSEFVPPGQPVREAPG
jgi:hypothetical protein